MTAVYVSVYKSPLSMRVYTKRLPALALILAAGLSLTACQSGPVRDRVVTVSVPIATHPVQPADVPKLPAPLPKRPANVSSALDLALSKWCEGVAYMLRADPLLRVSAGLPPLEPQLYPECER